MTLLEADLVCVVLNGWEKHLILSRPAFSLHHVVVDPRRFFPNESISDIQSGNVSTAKAARHSERCLRRWIERRVHNSSMPPPVLFLSRGNVPPEEVFKNIRQALETNDCTENRR